MKRPRRSPQSTESSVMGGVSLQSQSHSEAPSQVAESSSAWTRTAAMVFQRHARQQPKPSRQHHSTSDAATSAAMAFRRPAPLHTASASTLEGTFSPRPPLSASSSSSSTTSNSSAASNPLLRTPSSDNLWWRSTVARKRSSPRSNSGLSLPAPQDASSPHHADANLHMPTTATMPQASATIGAGTLANSSSTSRRSFRRKRRRRGFCHLLQSRQAIRRLVLAVAALFCLSFSAAFWVSHPSLLRREASSQPELPTTRQLPHVMTRTISQWAPQSRRSLAPKEQKVLERDTTSIPDPKKRLRATRAVSKQEDRISQTEHNPNSKVESSESKLRKRDTLQRDNPYKFARYSTSAPTCDPVNPQDVDFTLVTQMSLNRLWMMEYHCARWKHAISIAVYTGSSNHDNEEHSPTTAESLADQLVEMNCAAHQVSVQTVTGYSDEEYPVNVLRNAALSAVRTSHVVYVDVDFWESSSLYQQLQQHSGVLASDPKLSLVVPAFAMVRQCPEYRDCREKNVPRMPQTKDDLIDLMLDHHQASAFDPSNVGGHGSTRYKEWLGQADDELLPIECIKSNRYEPYLVVRYCHDLPPFQEAFTGYGKNKMTWVMQLRRTGYHFMQVGGGAFVVHYPHLDSTARLHWNGGAEGEQLSKPKSRNEPVKWTAFKRGQIDETFVVFRNWLTRTVPDTSVVPMCEDALNDDERLWTDNHAAKQVAGRIVV